MPPKVVLAKVGLDGHDRGIKIIARSLRDAGMEVVYLGMRLTPDQVAAAANQEDADVIGISILSGAHLRLVSRLAGALEDRGMLGKALLLVGGTIPEQDVPSLLDLGVDQVFPVGAFSETMIEFIRANIRSPGR